MNKTITVCMLLFAFAASASASIPSAQDLLGLTDSCTQVSNGKFSIDKGSSRSVPICALNGAVFWKADMDIDCDGIVSAQCNKKTDPWFSPDTSALSSTGQFLNAAKLPWVTIPVRSKRFNFKKAGTVFGSVVAAIYNGKVVYGVFGDENGDGIIGEASYAMASELGVNPDPREGGVDEKSVTYIAFTGPSSVVKPIEDHSAAVVKGQVLDESLVANNR